MSNDPIKQEKPVTSGQINKLTDRLRSILEKANFFNDAFQQILEGDQTLDSDLLKFFQERHDRCTGTIKRNVVIDRTRTAQEAVKSIQKVRPEGFINNEVVDEVPKNTGLKEEVLSLVHLGESVSVADLPGKLADMGYELVDFYAFISFIDQNQNLADEFPVVTQWNRNCYALASLWRGVRRLSVYRDDGDWRDRDRFVCRPLRNSPQSLTT